jgi:UPF0716 family protein affecting phage T7 exclusion
MVHQFDAMGLDPSFRLLAGSIELIAGLMLMIPRAGAVGAVILACLMVATAGATLGHLATLRPLTESASLPLSHTYQGFIAREHGAGKGQVRRLLDFFAGAASFESCILRPTWASYS